MVKFAVDTFGGVDVIVSKYICFSPFFILFSSYSIDSAGFQHIEAVDELSLKEWKKVTNPI